MDKILLFGNSTHMLSLAARLKGMARLEVMHATRADLSGVEDMHGLNAIIVDLDTGPLGTTMSLFRACPDLVLLGLDSAGDSIIVLSGPSQPAQSVEEVLACIKQYEWPTLFRRCSPARRSA